jgi:hypothetical protein
MKIRVTLKDPDTMQDAVDEAFKRHDKPVDLSKAEWQGICEGRAEAAKEAISKRWMRYGEYLDVEFDLDAGTATVLPATD